MRVERMTASDPDPAVPQSRREWQLRVTVADRASAFRGRKTYRFPRTFKLYQFCFMPARRSRSGEINALFRGSSLRKTSSLDLGWQGVAIERRTAEPGESPEEEVDHHFIAMWDRQAALGERADLRGKFVPYAAGASRLLPSLRGLGRMMEVQVENDLGDSANGADHALEAKAFAHRLATNQQTLRADIRGAYHFIVCGSGVVRLCCGAAPGRGSGRQRTAARGGR